MKIRNDLIGVVTAYKDGNPIVLKAGDTVPAGVTVGSHVAVGQPDTDPDSPFAGMKAAELKAYAEEHGIDLGTATKVAEVRAILEAATAPADGQGDGSDPSQNED